MNEKQLEKSIAIFSHKLKNPLHAAVINLEVLQVKLKKSAADEELMTHVKIVCKEVQRLQAIVTKYFDYLQLNDTQKAKIDLEKVLGKV